MTSSMVVSPCMTLYQPYVAHRDIAVADGLLAEFRRLGAVGDEFLHRRGEQDHFVNGEPPGEAGVAAAVAAFRGIGLAGNVQRECPDRGGPGR